jgi:hypothetical protein
VIRDRRPGFGPEQHEVDRPPLGFRQDLQHRIVDVRQHVGQRRVGQVRLGRRRAARQNTKAALTRLIEGGKPQCRLADPGLALQHESLRLRGQRIKESRDRSKFRVTADHIGAHAVKAPIRSIKRKDGTVARPQGVRFHARMAGQRQSLGAQRHAWAGRAHGFC